MPFIYTDEMKEQDALWDSGKEDVEIMAKLQKQIVKQAYEQGFEGKVFYHKFEDEHVTEVYNTYEDWYKENHFDENGQLYTDFEESYTSGTCRGLIEHFKGITKEIKKSHELEL